MWFILPEDQPVVVLVELVLPLIAERNELLWFLSVDIADSMAVKEAWSWVR